MSDNSTNPNLVNALPAHPLSNDTIKKLGESDKTVGTRPLSSRFNDLVTEFLLIADSGTYAIAFDPENETWSVLEHRPHDDMRDPEIEEQLLDRLQQWRQDHVVPYLAENELIPTFDI